MLVTPISQSGYNLLHEGALTFSDMQQNGIRIDTTHCKYQYRKLGKDIKEQYKKLMDHKEIKLWQKAYGKKFNINSDDQLSNVLYKKLKHTPQKTTETGNSSVDQEALQALGIPMVDDYLRYRKLDKIRNTFLRNLLREQSGGWLHPFLKLNTARTFRSCVAKGTRVLTPQNLKRFSKGTRIEKIKAGDYVYCFDDNLQPTLKKVLWAGKTGHKEVIRLHWKSRGRSGYLEVTPEHLIRKTNGEYEEAQNLLSYDLRSENNGKRSAKHKVLACSRHGDRLYFTYHIGKHNKGIHEHRFVYKNLIDNNLKDHEIIHHINGNHRITKIEWTGKKVDVYDLEVENCHNFIANEICVHNSSDKINIQNQPTRDPEAGEIIRRAFISREGHCMVAGDYGGVEVKGSAWYHKDPTMLGYLRDPENSDMHSDFCISLFKLPGLGEEIKGEKTLRKGTKNGFTFPQFYGDYYGNNAVSLFGWADLKTKKKGIDPSSGVHIRGDVPLGKHLRDNGIKNFDQFTRHVQNIEEDMWQRRFKTYKKWRDDQYDWYLKHGYVTILSGFVCKGIMTRNATINYPIQGVCFHALLWSVIQINKEIKRRGMKTKLIFQVHDEIVADVPVEEYDDFMELMKQIMVHDIRDHFTFINTPLELEAEASDVDGNWFEMESVMQYIH